MAQIATAPIVLKDARFLVAADSYESAVSGVTFTPSASTVTWKGLTPSSVFTGTSTATWTCELAYAQDWTTTNSLAQYLLANEGKTIVAKFIPQTAASGTVPTFTATIIITPGAIGGTVDAVATATVTLGVVGRPVLTVAAVPA
jgi:hypothetical protein